MNKIRKILPYVLMIWPYMFIPFAILSTLKEDSSTLTTFVMSVYMFLTLVVYAINICNAFIHNNAEDERTYASRLAFYNMVIKLVHIPFYLGVFVIGFIALAIMVVPAFSFFSPFIIFMLFIIDTALMLTSSMYGISAAYRASKTGMISKGSAAAFGIFHCFFISDVISAIILRRKLHLCCQTYKNLI